MPNGPINEREQPLALWDADPVKAFEQLRDDITAAMNAAITIHEEAVQHDSPSTPLSAIRTDLHNGLFRAVDEAQAIWFDSPIRRYIDRADGPVHLDTMEARATGRVSGSSYHDLALAVTSTLCRTIQAGTQARDWTDYMRFSTAVGDGVAGRWNELLAHVRCECQTGIVQWKMANEQSGLALDSSAFRPAKEFLDPEHYKTHKQLCAALKANPWIRTRKPSPQRLEIHAGDWQRFRTGVETDAFAALDTTTQVESSTVKQFLAESRQRQDQIRRRKAGK